MWPYPFSWKNSSNIANRVFPGKGRGDRALILTYLDSPMAEVLPHYCLSFSISAIFRGKRMVKVGRKVQTLRPSLVHKNLNPSNFFQTMFLFPRVLPLVKPPKKGYFMDAESVRKTLKIFNWQPQMLFLWNLPRLCIFIRV